MIRLLIADDHAIVRQGLCQLIALTEDIYVAGQATRGAEVLKQIGLHTFDLLLLDLNLQDQNGMELIGEVRQHAPSLPILIYSMHQESHVATSALNAGANGFFTKNSDPALLMTAIRKVASGGHFIDPVLAEKMAFDSAFPKPKPPHMLLSEREQEIFQLLLTGKSVNQIAEQLFISNKTVSTHKINLMLKLGIDNVPDMVRYAAQHGLSKR